MNFLVLNLSRNWQTLHWQSSCPFLGKYVGVLQYFLEIFKVNIFSLNFKTKVFRVYLKGWQRTKKILIISISVRGGGTEKEKFVYLTLTEINLDTSGRLGGDFSHLQQIQKFVHIVAEPGQYCLLEAGGNLRPTRHNNSDLFNCLFEVEEIRHPLTTAACKSYQTLSCEQCDTLVKAEKKVNVNKNFRIFTCAGRKLILFIVYLCCLKIFSYFHP